MSNRQSLTFNIKRNDLGPALTIQAAYKTDPVTYPDLSSATSPKFIMVAAGAPDGTTPKVSATATIYDGPNGKLRYSWQGTDTDTAGTYRAEFEVVISGRKQTFPEDGYLVVNVLQDIG